MKFQSRILITILSSVVSIQTVGAVATGRVTARLTSCINYALNPSTTSVDRVVTPWDDTYTDARTASIIRPVFPALIVYATTASEVAGLVRCARYNGIQAVPRSGGHHFEGWSALNGTLVIDVSHLDNVAVSADKKTAVVGGGIRMGALYTALNLHNVTFNGGICPTIGLSGYLSSGGYNLQMRSLGMAGENLISAKVVLASGDIVTASATQNPDLYWAIRGGGTYGIVVETTLKLITLPRSAMVTVNYPLASTRYEVTRKYIDWAPRAVKEFNSQINMYRDSTYFVGWYLGGSVAQLQAILDASGLLDIEGAVVNVSGGCSTSNSRVIWFYSVPVCIPDDEAEEMFASFFNVVPQAEVPVGTPFAFDEVPQNPNQATANPWPAADIINKSYMIKKNNQFSDETLHGIIDRIGASTPEAGFWAELTSFNITTTPSMGNIAYPWLNDGYALFRTQVNTGTSAAERTANQAWMDDFDTFVRPRVGPASYAGYIDANIGGNPATAYYGSSVCRLVQVRKQYDPRNFFSNPFSIGPTPPAGVTCP